MKNYYIALPVLLIAIFGTTYLTPQVKMDVPAGSDPVALLQKGDFDQARLRADEILAAGNDNPEALLVRAVSQYVITTRGMGMELMSRRRSFGEIDVAHIRSVFRTAESDFARIQADLDKAAEHGDISIALAPSAWEGDWNMDGTIDDADRRLFQIEYDEKGTMLAEDDPRRNPEYRFDAGDVLWASAYIHFQRAALDLALAYDWSALTTINSKNLEENALFVLKLIEPGRMVQFREQLLLGLDSSDRSRRAFLAEADDDREWVPNPSQKSNPMPMKLSKSFYATWESLVKNLRRIVTGNDVLDPASVFGFLYRDKKTTGYIDFGKILEHPKDIEINIQNILMLASKDDRDGLCREIFGKNYIFKAKSISPIYKNLMRMSAEIRAGSDTFTNKLKYLIWVN